MKRTLSWCAAAFLLFGPVRSVLAGTPDVEEILSYPEESGRELIYGTGFENPEESTITLEEGFRFAPGEGNNGNGGLRADRVGPVDRPISADIALPPEKVTPGNLYRVVLNVKGKDLRHVSRPEPPGSHRFLEICYTDAKTGEQTFNDRRVIPFAKPPAGEDFQEFSCTFPGIEGAQAHLRLMLWLDFLGTIWFDDLRVYREGVIAHAFLTYPACSTFFTDSGRFKIKIHCPGRSPVALIELQSGDKILHRQVIVPEGGFAEGDFGKGLPPGEGKLRVTLADTEKKRRLSTVEIPVFIREPEKAPSGACTLDEDGFMIQGGKRTLPLGVFFAMPPELREEHLKRIGESPYDFIIDYSALSMAASTDDEKITALRRGLDRVHANGLKIVCSLIAFYREDSNIVKRGRWSGETTMEGWTGKFARELKDHPALMGFYLTDELSLDQLARPIQLRRVLNREDPYHPAFTLTNVPSVLPAYAESGDILLIDPYPLSTRVNGTAAVKAKYDAFFEEERQAGTPVWSVPQGFNWGAEGKNLPQFKGYIDPSEEDMRSLMLLSLLEGAKGICLFMYPIPWNPKRIEELARYGLQKYPEELWERQKKAGAAVKKLEPYFISSVPVSELRIENRGKGEVKARLWRTEDGKTALVIVGTGGGPAEAVITVPGCDGLKSEFGHTENLGEGKYRFTSKDLASDMLFEKR